MSIGSGDRPQDVAVKFGGTAALLLMLAGLASHPLPGSLDSLLRGLMFGVPGGLVVGLAVFLFLRARRGG